MSFFANTAPQQQVKKVLANISEDALNSNQQAVPVPYLAGRAYVTGAYITPAYNPKAVPIKTQGGKGSSSQTTDYKYYADFALMFCMGGRRPVDAIRTVVMDSEVLWSGNVQRGTAEKEVITVAGAQGGDQGMIHLYWGSETQPIDGVLLTPRGVATGSIDPTDSTTFPPAPAGTGGQTFKNFAAGDVNPFSGHYDKHPAYRGQCYAVFKNWKLGRGRTSVPNIIFELVRGCPAPWITGGTSPGFDVATDQGVNPAAILYDWLTDTRFGMGLSDSQLDLTSFKNLYYTLDGIFARLSPVITQQNDFRQTVANLLEYYDGWIRNNGGQIQVGLFSHGTITSSGTLTDDDLLGNPALTPTGWGPTMNEVSIVYQDRLHHFNTYAQSYRDPNNFRITGTPRPTVLQRSWITDANQAKHYAREYGAILALPDTTGQLVVKREWLTNNHILPGNVFLYNSAYYSLSFYLRLLEVEHDADSSAKATMTVQLERAKWPSLYIPPGFQGPGGFVLGPRAIWESRVTEVPYLLTNHAFLTQIVCLAVQGNVEVMGYRIWASFDNGATYDCLANTNNFGAFGILAYALGAGTNSGWFYVYGPNHDQIVQSQTNTQGLDDTLLCFIDAEVYSLTTVFSYGGGLKLIYMYPGRLGTTKATHAVNAQAFFIPRSLLHILDNAGFAPGATVLFKLQPFTADTDYDLTTVTPISYLVSGWAPLQPPVFSPPPGPFVGSLFVYATAAPGTTMHYTRDGTQPGFGSPIWGTAPLNVTTTITLRIIAVTQDGRQSGERIATYTKVQQIPGQPAPGVQCAQPHWSFSGNQHYTAGNLTLTPVTAGSTIHYALNSGTTHTYAGPIPLASNPTGDIVEYWASLAGLDDSPHGFFSNTKNTPGGGGTSGFPPQLPP
jgi:hypothetical protein